MATTKYVAFLRAINVGGHVVKMDALRALCEAIGLTGVETYIASGNVIFESANSKAALVKQIEAHLKAELGYEVATFVRSAAEVKRIAAQTPFAEVTPSASDRTYVNFLRGPLPAATRQHILALANDDDRLAVIGSELYWLRRGPLLEATIDTKALDRLMGVSTNRNMNTIRKLAAKL